MSAPRVTILTPVKNGERYLQACLDSVEAARAGGVTIEHIFIDGASTDGTLEMLARAHDTKVFSKPGMSPIETLEWARPLATGDYVMWLMADDLLGPDLARLVGEIPAACQLALFSCELFGDGRTRVATPPRRLWTVLKKYPGMNSALVRRDLFARTEMPCAYYFANDRAMTLSLIADAEEIMVSDAVLARMRLHDQSITHATGDKAAIARDFLALGLDLAASNRGPARDVFTAYAWRRALKGGRWPPLGSLVHLPSAYLRLARQEDALKPTGELGPGASVVKRPFAFVTTGTRPARQEESVGAEHTHQ